MEHRVTITYTCPDQDTAEDLLACYLARCGRHGPVLSYTPAHGGLATIAVGIEAANPFLVAGLAQGVHNAVRGEWEDREGMWPDDLRVAAVQVGEQHVADALRI